MRTGSWLLAWLAATTLATGTTYAAVTAHAEATCTTDLCFAELTGFLAAFVVLAVCLVAWLADAVRRSRAPRPETRPTRTSRARRPR